MIYYGKYDEQGNYIGFYNEEIHGTNIPSGCVELTEDEWQEALTGDYKVVDGVHTHTPKTQEQLDIEELGYIRNERNTLLSQSDWTQFNDSPLSEENKQEWKVYRQELRDMTNSKPYTFPIKPVN